MIDFPSAPTAGQIFASGDLTYKFDGTMWVSSPPTGALADAPSDGVQYGRQDAAWTPVVAGGLADAPIDTVTYARKDAAWVATMDATAIAAADALHVLKAGDTMTGPLVLPLDPVNALEATTKQYVDARTVTIPVPVNQGGTAAIDAANALINLGIANHNYLSVMVDPGYNAIRWLGDKPQMMLVLMASGPTGEVSFEFNRDFVPTWKMRGPVGTDLDWRLDRLDPLGVNSNTPLFFSGLTGLGTVAGDPTDPLGIATKAYVDASAGGLTDAPVDTKQYARQDAAWTEVVKEVTSGDVAPATPFPNQLWFNTLTGYLFIWYVDADSSQWVQVNNATTDGGIAEAPNDGKIYGRQNVDWTEIVSGSSVFTGDAPPATPVENQMWFDSATGYLFIYYNDGNTTQWVQVNAASVSSGGGAIDTDAPSDGTPYSRQDAGWVPASAGGAIPDDAPVDTKIYGRKDAAWEEVTAGSTFLTGTALPTVADGKIGDYYIHTPTEDIYGPKSDVVAYGPAQSAIDDSSTPFPSINPTTGTFGLNFKVLKNGRITQLHFFYNTDATDTGRTLRLWNAAGVEIASGVSAAEVPGTWYAHTLATPVDVLANDVLTVSYDVTANYANGKLAVASVGADIQILGNFYDPAAGLFPTAPASLDAMVDITFEPTTTEEWMVSVQGDSARLKDGSAQAPSFAYISEPNMGWYRSGAGSMALAVHGTPQLEFSQPLSSTDPSALQIHAGSGYASSITLWPSAKTVPNLFGLKLEARTNVFSISLSGRGSYAGGASAYGLTIDVPSLSIHNSYSQQYVSLSSASGDVQLALHSTNGRAYISGRNNTGSPRWRVNVVDWNDGDSESGGNNGSNFSLESLADDGTTSLGRPLSIKRATSTVNFLVRPTVAGVPMVAQEDIEPLREKLEGVHQIVDGVHTLTDGLQTEVTSLKQALADAIKRIKVLEARH
jgi:hypothetical protein